MLTYDEAIGLFLIEGSNTDTPEKLKLVESILNNSMDRYQSMLNEIQANKKSFVFANFILQMGVEQDLCPHELIVVALSHGVAVGMEMERQDAITS